MEDLEMPTAHRRLYFVPTDETRAALTRISDATGKPVSSLLAEIVGYCESYLVDQAACLDQIDDIKAKLQEDLADFHGDQLAFNLTVGQWDQAQRAINRANSRLDMLRNRDSAFVSELLEIEPQGMA